jgi:hypothetical protein
MQLIRTVLLLSWISACLFYRIEAQGQTSTTDTPKHMVSGTVVNAVTGSPISRALVELNSNLSRYTMTDGNGEFRFEGVEKGSVKVAAERPTFFKSTDAASGDGASSEFQVDRDISGIALKLVPWAEVAVHVRSVTGVPIQDYPVRLYERQIVDGSLQWGNTTSVVSDVNGFCRIFSVHQGSYILSGGPELWRRRPLGAKHVGYPMLFYPNAHELSEAGMFTVTAGQKVEIDFSLNQESLFEVSGIVVDVPESVDTKIELSSSVGDPAPLAQPHPAKHEFFGYATAGKYILRASAELNGKPMRATVPLTIDTNTVGIRVVLAPQISIPVNLRSDFDVSNGVRVSGVPSTNVRLKSTVGFPPTEIATTIQVERQNGNVMELAGVEPGRYSVEIDSFSGYVKTATSGSTNLLQDDLVVPETGTVERIEIVLSNDGGEIVGNVKLPDPNGVATVLLVPERGSTKTLMTVSTQPGGTFTFNQIAPGDYLLFAFDRIKDLEYRNADLLGNYRSRATHIEVSPHQHVTTTLEVIGVEK